MSILFFNKGASKCKHNVTYTIPISKLLIENHCITIQLLNSRIKILIQCKVVIMSDKNWIENIYILP